VREEIKMVIGYIRTSTLKQENMNQRLEIGRYTNQRGLTIDNFIEIQVSSTKSLKERKIEDLLNILHFGDELIVSELSRLGRSTKQVLELLDTFQNMGVKLHLIKENMIIDKNSENPMSRMILTVLSAFNTLERELLSLRVKEALQSKKEQGVKLGNPRKHRKSKLDGKEKEIKDLLDKKITKSNIARMLDVDRSTLNNFITSRKLSA
jgi:DNA invertase Pin-like site-specific DNA recombinase